MANQKEIRSKISSTKKTMKITSAMKLVAAAKVNKIQKILLANRPYAQAITNIFSKLKQALSEEDLAVNYLLCNHDQIKSVLLLIVSSDRGLCAAYNTTVIKAAKLRIEELLAEGKKVSLVTIGRKAKTAFQKASYQDRGVDVLKSYIHLNSIPTKDEANMIATHLIEMYTSDTIDKVEVLRTKFNSLVSSEVELINFLPIEASAISNDAITLEPYVILEPNAQELINTLAPLYSENRIYQSLLEATTSELAARMTAMSNATNNAKEVIKNLVLAYNKARQASITQEISEIVGGAAALA